MAKKIQAQVQGGRTQADIEAETVQDVANALGLTAGGYQAVKNGEPAAMKDLVTDFDHLCFAPAVKGGKQ